MLDGTAYLTFKTATAPEKYRWQWSGGIYVVELFSSVLL
jgi:hypothetical protein